MTYLKKTSTNSDKQKATPLPSFKTYGIHQNTKNPRQLSGVSNSARDKKTELPT